MGLGGGRNLQIIEEGEFLVPSLPRVVSQPKGCSSEINQPSFGPGKGGAETDDQVEALLPEAALHLQLLEERDSPASVGPVLGFFIDEDFVQVRVAGNGVLAVADHQRSQVGLWKSLTQGPNGRGAAEHVADVIIPDNQNFLNPAGLKVGLIQRPALVNSKVE